MLYYNFFKNVDLLVKSERIFKFQGRCIGEGQKLAKGFDNRMYYYVGPPQSRCIFLPAYVGTVLGAFSVPPGGDAFPSSLASFGHVGGGMERNAQLETSLAFGPRMKE